jgi:hypothetical protein
MIGILAAIRIGVALGAGAGGGSRVGGGRIQRRRYRHRHSGEPLDAIFEEFTQADPEIGKSYGGTGLGLAISRRLAQLLGGTLAVDNEVGRGSTFRFRVRLSLPPG